MDPYEKKLKRQIYLLTGLSVFWVVAFVSVALYYFFVISPAIWQKELKGKVEQLQAQQF